MSVAVIVTMMTSTTAMLALTDCGSVVHGDIGVGVRLDEGIPGLMAPPMELDIGLPKEEQGEKSRIASSDRLDGGGCQLFFFSFEDEEWPEHLERSAER